MSIWNGIARFVARPTIANWLIRRAMTTPYTHLPRTDDPSYMARYWVFNPYDRVTNKPRWFFCPWSIRVHHIKREDFDRDMHDHPWNARTIILKGWYTEKRLLTEADRQKVLSEIPQNAIFSRAAISRAQVSETFYRQAGDTAKLGFGQYHAITSVSDDGVWTLFISGPWRGVWGFLVDGVKIPWKTYLGVPEHGDLDDPVPPVNTEADAQSMQDDASSAESKRAFATGGFVGQHGEVPQIISTEHCVSLGHARRLGLADKVNINREYGKFGSVSVPFPFFTEHELKESRERINGQLTELERLERLERFKARNPMRIVNCDTLRAVSKTTDRAGLTTTHHPLRNIIEWRKGCSCATPGSPAECTPCTVGLIEAIERWHEQNNCVHGGLIGKLAAMDVDALYSEDEVFVAEAAQVLGFETVDDDASVYACTLGQLVTLMRAHGADIKGRE